MFEAVHHGEIRFVCPTVSVFAGSCCKTASFQVTLAGTLSSRERAVCWFRCVFIACAVRYECV